MFPVPKKSGHLNYKIHCHMNACLENLAKTHPKELQNSFQILKSVCEKNTGSKMYEITNES